MKKTIEFRKCYQCGGTMELRKVKPLFFQNHNIDMEVDGYVCSKCGEMVFTSEVAKQIERMVVNVL